ncbi:MAG: hypothetical protein OEW58_10505, partial [Gammaproteobacteria bacterium]|nr:hypothetical protein [Gammaproteobacteria bacterium]
MKISSVSTLFSYGAVSQSSLPRQYLTDSAANVADTVRISNAAREAFSASQSAGDSQAIETRLAQIKTKGAMSRTQEEHDFVLANDQRWADIRAQESWPDHLTADDLDYVQKAGGLVNTMAMLSDDEKALYDKAVAAGNEGAVSGLTMIAMTRMIGPEAGGENGESYNPLTTKITAANIEKYFSHSIIDATGEAQSKFQSLKKFLNENSITAA